MILNANNVHSIFKLKKYSNLTQQVFFEYGLNIFVQNQILTIKIRPVSHQLKIDYEKIYQFPFINTLPIYIFLIKCIQLVTQG